MPSQNHYPKKYIDECRSKLAAQVFIYQALVAAARKQTGPVNPQLAIALTAFESVFFNNMVIVMDRYFVQRMRAMEMKDGNSLNEVRMLVNSMMNNDSKLYPDNTIKYDPARSVLKYRIGDEIKVKEAEFILLSSAFFADLEKKYVSPVRGE
jgi:hypothetical protein